MSEDVAREALAEWMIKRRVGVERAYRMIDPFEPANIPTDVEAKRARKTEAETLVDDKGVFMLAVRSLSRTWYAELVTSPERERMLAAGMKLQALESIVPEIKRFINDHAFAVDKAKKHG